MKTSYSPYSITAAVDAARNIMGSFHFISSNNNHHRFLYNYDKVMAEVVPSGVSISTIASFDCEVINKWLKERGFTIGIKFAKDDEHFGTAAALKVVLSWLSARTQQDIRTNGEEYPGFCMHVDKFTLGESTVYSFKDANDFNVYISEVPSEKLIAETELDLLDNALSLSGNSRRVELVIPMIDYNQESRFDWLENLHLANKDMTAKIEVALQQNIFKMDNIGALVKSAAVVGFSGYSGYSSSPKDFITKPFLLWVYAPKCNIPFFIGHFGYEHWKKPVRDKEWGT